MRDAGFAAHPFLSRYRLYRTYHFKRPVCRFSIFLLRPYQAPRFAKFDPPPKPPPPIRAFTY